jgi:hypothetical protein
MKLIDDIGFDASFSFVYSARPGTPAAELADDTPQEVKLALMRLQKRIDEQYAGHQRGHGRHGAARAGRRPVEEGRQRDGRPHRQQPHRQLRRQSERLIGTVRRRAHHRRAAAQPARRNRHPGILNERKPWRAIESSSSRSTTPAGQSVRRARREPAPDRERLRRHHRPRGERFTLARREGAGAARRDAAAAFLRAATRTLSVDEIQLGLIEINRPPQGRPVAAARRC